MSTRWKVILAVSLAVNLFIVGALVGMGVVGARLLRDRYRPGDGQHMIAAFQALPPDRRQALRDIMRTQAMDAAGDLRTARAARDEALKLMAADPYDPNAVAAALTRARDAETHARARVDATLASRLAQLSPQERATFSRMLMRGAVRVGPRGPRGGGPAGPGGPPGPGGDQPPPPPPPPAE